MELDTFIRSALIVLAATSITVVLFRHFGLGSVLGLLVAGIIVGPGSDVTRHVEDIRNFTELGIVLLLFIIGLEMRPSRLWEMRREVFGLGLLQIVVCGASIAVYATFYFDSWQAAFVVGATFALSSTAFVMQILHERGEIASEQGTTAFAILLMQDLAIVPLLAIIPIISTTGPLSSAVPLWQQFIVVVLMLGLIFGFSRYVVPFALTHVVRQRNREGFLLVVMLAVFLAAWAMHKAGASMALGAFITGMLLSDSRYRLQIQAAIEPFKGLLMALFFVAVGMSIDFRALAAQPLLFAQHTVIIIGLKVAILIALLLAFGYARGVATRVAFLLAQGGEFGFVLLGSAKVLAVIDELTFVYSIGVISVTMLLTPVLVYLGERITRRLEGRQTATVAERPTVDEANSGRTVIIGGYGRVGHTVATLLHTSGVPILVFDSDPARVAQGRKDGLPVYDGDIGDPDLLDAAHVDQAALVLLTIDHSAAAFSAVSHIRSRLPTIPIITRARDLQTSSRLLQAGATHAFPEALESSLRLGAQALEMINVPSDSVERLLSGVRTGNYRLVAYDREKGTGGEGR